MNEKKQKIDYNKRLSSLRERIKAAEVDVLLVSEPHNIFYLCGCAGGLTGARVLLVVDSATSVLIIDRRYFDEARETSFADEIIAWSKSVIVQVVDDIRQSGAVKTGFEATHITVKQYESMLKEFEGIRLVGVSNLVEPLREIKDEYEVGRIAEAATIGDRAFDFIIEHIKPGMTEREVVLELDYFMLRNGAEKLSFDTIVASGVHSAIPHATPSSKEIKIGDFVKLDFGAVIGGYHSDMTRTVVVGKASAKQRELYQRVYEAQHAALDAVAPGIRGEELDAVARDMIEAVGHGQDFSHNLGHGVGLNVHELPVIGVGSKSVLRAGMAITIEPGIYVNGFGGVRIEDLVIVNEFGRTVLTHSTKQLLEL